MRYAVVPGLDQTTEAWPKARGACPTCEAGVIAKCGQINAWHWAHERVDDCDPWSEPMSWWHRSWQDLAPRHRREVRMGNHRADIVSSRGTVFEIQHSSIGVEEIQAREAFYGANMVWVFDVREAYFEDRLDLRIKPGAQPDLRTFRWKHARKSIAACRRTVLLDLGFELLHLKRIHPEAPCGGWGLVIPKARVAAVLAATPEEGTAA